MRSKRLINRNKNRPRNNAISKNRKDNAYLITLDSFTSQDLENWSKRSKDLDQYAAELFYGFESQRAAIYGELCSAIKEASKRNIELKNWGRIVSYKYSNYPLSAAGSLKLIGGRFNFGADINPNHFQGFPALYIASDHSTAFLEKFKTNNLDEAENHSLGGSKSYSWVELTGRLNNLFDLTDKSSLKLFCKLIKDFHMPESVTRLAKQLKITPPLVISTVAKLRDSLLEENWAQSPTVGEVPSNSQVFGKLVRDSGAEGILYPSVRGKGICIALFTENLIDGSYLELTGEMPAATTVRSIGIKV